MTSARLLVGDSRTRTADIDDHSVEMLLTSAPFLALRSYLPADHPDKGSEIGSEADPAAFLDTLLALTADWRRVLAPYGSLCVELGDTYSGSGGAGGDYNAAGLREGQPKFRQSSGWHRLGVRADQADQPPNYRKDGTSTNSGSPGGGPGWPLPKSLALIPTLYPACLAYGRNILTGEPSPAGRWRIRNLLVWARPNPPVGALGDKFRPATSYVTVATMAADRWFDLDAVRVSWTAKSLANIGCSKFDKKSATGPDSSLAQRATNMPTTVQTHPAGAPPLDWHDDGHDFDTALDHFLADQWQPLLDLPTAPYKGAHYATFPPELPRRLIEAMCPRQVCRVCGTPRRRITEDNPELAAAKVAVGDKWQSGGLERGMKRPKGADRIDVSGHKLTLGWSDCGHDDYRPGVVLDPFAGSGTTLAVATGCGRDAIGIELDPRCVDLIRQRVGMFLEVDEGETAA